MTMLNEQWFKDNGFNTDSEPYKLGRVTAYKNYRRDGSGHFKGYSIEKPAVITASTVEELKEFLEKE